MYFNFACSECGKNLKVREENAGRKARCPYCHATVVVPETPAPESESTGKGVPKIDVGSVTSTLPAKRKPAGKKSGRKQSSQSAVTDGTNVSMLKTALVGLALTAAFYVLVFPFYLAGTYFGDLFYQRGWVTPTEAFLMFWSVAILIFKFQKLKRQREAMLFDALPESLSPEITVSTLDKFTSHVRELPVDPGESFLIQRVLRGLEHFRVRKNAAEVASMMGSQSEIDGAAVDSSYSLLNVFIWAIPILGFIGTVQGLGGAVGELSASLEGAESVDQIKEVLQNITGGLGTAFDTTLVALIMSVMLKFPASSMQKAEEDVLNSVDEYCNENLIRRLNDGGAAGRDAEPNTAVVQELIAAVGKQMNELVAQHQKATLELSERTANVQNEVVKSMRTTNDSLQKYVAGIQGGIGALNNVLESLGEKRVVIQTQPAKRGWFGRRNGGR
jgi:DNA-directed RNA polymerase subunit RPC12/RpoP